MPRPSLTDPAAITLRLQAGGPQTALALAAAQGVDRSQISRAVDRMGDVIVRMGVTRGTLYALRRPVRGAVSTFSVRRIDERGFARDWAELTSVYGGWRLTWANAEAPPAWASLIHNHAGLCEGFPFFLEDVRPQGFLGRARARVLPSLLALDANPGNWSYDDTMIYLQGEGGELPGDIVVGDAALNEFNERRSFAASLLEEPRFTEADRARLYPLAAEDVNAEGVRGSSIEGEQPKFVAAVARADGNLVPVIVKFTDRLTTPTGRRWADLLVGEVHASAVLGTLGESVMPPAQLLDVGGRRFYEIERFDRVGNFGRRGIVSLRALHDALPVPDASRWLEAARNFAQRELISPETLRSIQLRQVFGELIGNTDMHFGNLAFWLDDSLPFRLAPVYDMLPMNWAPQPGNAEPAPAFLPSLPLPADRELWHLAAVGATEFWQRLGDDPRVSEGFATIARDAGATILRLRALA